MSLINRFDSIHDYYFSHLGPYLSKMLIMMVKYSSFRRTLCTEILLALISYLNCFAGPCLVDSSTRESDLLAYAHYKSVLSVASLDYL